MKTAEEIYEEMSDENYMISSSELAVMAMKAYAAEALSEHDVIHFFLLWFKENGGFPIEDYEVEKYVKEYLKLKEEKK